MSRIRLAVTVLVAGAALVAAPMSAQARALPVNYDFATGALAGFLFPQTPPPGADNFGCKPSSAHPDPVILVNGTFGNQDDNWQAASPLLANHGYCVFTFNYGGSSASAVVQGTGDIAASAGQLASFVTRVLAATGAAKVDLVGHSQGGMMPRYYLKFLGGAAFVNRLVALAPSNHGTTLDGLTALVRAFGAAGLVNGALNALCTACVEQEAGSAFLANLNAGGDTVAGVSYTVIESRERRGGHAVHVGVPVRPRRHQHHPAEPVRPGPDRSPGDRGRPGRAGRRAERARPRPPGARPLPGGAPDHRPGRPGALVLAAGGRLGPRRA